MMDLGNRECAWGGVAKHAGDCIAPATRMLWKLDVVDAADGPVTGIVTVPVCDVHGSPSPHEWTEVTTEDDWHALLDAWQPRVWRMERQPSGS